MQTMLPSAGKELVGGPDFYLVETVVSLDILASAKLPGAMHQVILLPECSVWLQN